MSLFSGAIGGFVMAILASQFADRGRLSRRTNALISTATFVLAAPLFALLPETVSSPITSILIIAIFVVAMVDPEVRSQFRSAKGSRHFRISMFIGVPAVVLALYVAVALVFSDVSKLPMIAGGVTGAAILLALAAFLSKGNHEK